MSGRKNGAFEWERNETFLRAGSYYEWMAEKRPLK
jgi:hypothetical protein